LENLLKQLAEYTSLLIEAVAVIVVAFGAMQAFFHCLAHVHRQGLAGWRKELIVRFGVWLLVGLQFALAADIVRSVIAPSWNDIGQLAAIAAIRTILNYFLERDLREFEVAGQEHEA
jgi:uncharacterized membrane protein